MPETPNTRRYDLDWLRVILFGILVPYHALIGFVSYGANVYGYRNQDTGGDLAEFTIFVLHNWRLPALFLISGVGTYFLFRNQGIGPFLKNRTLRLLLPLIVGTLFWNGITSYYQVTAFGQDWSFWEYQIHRWQNLSFRATGHLWFLVNLFIYALLALPIFIWLRRNNRRQLILAACIVLICAAALILKPLVNRTATIEWNDLSYFAYYIIGFTVMYLPEKFWKSLEYSRYFSLLGALTCIAGLGAFLGVLSSDTDKMNIVINGGWVDKGWPFFSLLTFGYSTLYALSTAFCCATIFGFAHRYLNRASPMLARLNRLVYPFYIFHFVVLMVGLFYLRQISWPWFAEFLLLTIWTFTITGAVALFFDAIPPLRPLVGLAPRKRP